MKVRRLILRTLAVSMILLLLFAGVARAVYLTAFFTTVQLAKGMISGGTINMVQTIDGNTLNMTEGGAGGFDPLRYGMPYPDNSSGFGWANNCGSSTGFAFSRCLADFQRSGFSIYPFTDYNATIIWSTALPNNQSVKFDSTFWLFAGYKPIIAVGLYTVDRKNTTGAFTFVERIIDPVFGKVCISRTPSLPDLAWHIQPQAMSPTCAGQAWTFDLINRTEINFAQAATTGSKVTVSSAYWVIQLTSTTNNLDAYFNATVNAAAQTPYSVNWTCNRSAEDTYFISAFRQSTPSNPGPAYIVLNGNACPTGAQTSGSAILPTPGTWLSGNKFSVRVQGYGSSNPGTVRFDRLVFVVNQPIPGYTGKGIGGLDLTWIVFFFLIMSAMLLTAFKVKMWRER